MQAPSLKSMQQHFEGKHPKEVFDESKVTNKHEGLEGSTVKGIAVRGGYAKKNHSKDPNQKN